MLAISDYLAWVQARLGVYEAADFRGLANIDTWKCIVDALDVGEDSPPQMIKMTESSTGNTSRLTLRPQATGGRT